MIKFFAGALAGALAISCALSPLEKRLDPNSREFLSRVRYLIGKEERKTFLNLPPSEREAFVADFWRQRDPDSSTEVNEFRERYFARMEEANTLFSGGGSPGWLQDRGRVFILLGRPTNREAYPRGASFYGSPSEVWYYGFFPVVFVDHDWTGDYRLDPLSANQLAEIMSAQMDLKPKAPSDPDLDAAVDVATEERGAAVVRLRVPYRSIGFDEEDARAETTLRLRMNLAAESGDPVWEFGRDYDLDQSAEELQGRLDTELLLEVPVDKPLGGGRYVLTVRLQNTADEARVFRTVPFTLNAAGILVR